MGSLIYKSIGTRSQDNRDCFLFKYIVDGDNEMITKVKVIMAFKSCFNRTDIKTCAPNIEVEGA